jgi:hypothetical protein
MNLTAHLKRRHDVLSLTIRLDPEGDAAAEFEFVLTCTDAAFPLKSFRASEMTAEGAIILKKQLVGSASGAFPTVNVMAVFRRNYVGRVVARA